MNARTDYYLALYLAWTVRAVLAAGVLAVLAMSVSCTHSIDLNSKGSLTKDNPPVTNTITN